MALQSQLWSLATLMPMAESSLYRQRLEVIAEKRRLQEEIRAARRELEEEKLRVERLKRQSLRNHWLMDGAPAEGPEDPASQDPQSPAGQAQARIQTLEDSLFTLQSELQLLQGAATGAQHKPSGRPTWCRQDHRPLSQPSMDTGLADQAVMDRRASLPGGPLAMSPDAPASSEPREDAAGVPEANGSCRSPSLEAPAKGAGAEPDGEGVVRVVWEGLRATEASATGPTGPELEAKVEQVVLEAMADRPGPCSPELPAWARADRGAVEVVWEGVGGSDPEASPRLQEGVEGAGAPRGGGTEGEGHRGSAGEEGSFIWVERGTLSEEWEELLVEGLEGPAGAGAHREGGEDPWAVERQRAEREGSRDMPGTEGTPVEGLLEPSRPRSGEQLRGAETEGGEEPPGAGTGGEEPQGAGIGGGEELLGAGIERGEGPQGMGAGEEEPPRVGVGGEEPLGAGIEREEEPLGAGSGGEEPLRVGIGAGEEPLGAEIEGGEEAPGVETREEEPLGVGIEGGEEPLGEGTEVREEPLGAGTEGGEEPLREGIGGEEPVGTGTEAREEPLGARTEGEEPMREGIGGEEPVGAGTESREEPMGAGTGGEEPLGAGTEGEESLGEGRSGGEKTQGAEGDLNPEQRGARAGSEAQAEEMREAGAPLQGEEEPGQQPQEKQESSLEEEEAAKPLPSAAEGPGSAEDPTALLTETPAPEQPAERQPLLPRAGPSARPVPTYAPARQPEPPARREGEGASGPKQKTCQCCSVM